MNPGSDLWREITAPRPPSSAPLTLIKGESGTSSTLPLSELNKFESAVEQVREVGQSIAVALAQETAAIDGKRLLLQKRLDKVSQCLHDFAAMAGADDRLSRAIRKCKHEIDSFELRLTALKPHQDHTSRTFQLHRYQSAFDALEGCLLDASEAISGFYGEGRGHGPHG